MYQRTQIIGCTCNEHDEKIVSAEYAIEKILPVIDSLEWGIKKLTLEEKESPLGKGMILTYKKWLEAMRELEIVSIVS